jgi:hypothetical protein
MAEVEEVVMRRISAAVSVMGVLAVVALTAAVAVAQSTKSVRGAITAIGPASVTVSVDGKDMVFNVDAKTDITTPGGSTKTRAAQAQGKEGLKLADYLKVGQGVIVDYHEQGMHAASIRTLSAPPPPSPPPGAAPPPAAASASHNVTGVVTAVGGNSLTIKVSSGEMTFTIDDKTDVVAVGASTASREKQAAGQKTMITDFVGKGDTVGVTYRENAGAKTASEVRVRTKART